MNAEPLEFFPFPFRPERAGIQELNCGQGTASSSSTQPYR